MTTPPFDKTEQLAYDFAQKEALTWREQVHLEAALNNLYFDLGRPDMPTFIGAVSKFLNDVIENVLDD